MPLTQNMRNLFAKMLTTEDSTAAKFGSTTAWIHVGSSTQAVSGADNGCVSATVFAKAMNAGYPKRNDGTDSTGVNIWAGQATFTTSEANYDWQETAVKNTSATSTASGDTMTRFLPNLGIKTNTAAWQVTVKVTIST